MVALIITLGATASAAAATRLIVSNDACLVFACPATHPPPSTAVDAGSVFALAVIAVNDDGSIDLSYTGTVHLSSSDPLAVLPENYTFASEDGGRKGFPAVLNQLGAQSVTVADILRPSVSGTLTLVVNQSGPCVPATTVLCLDDARFRAEARWRVNGDRPIAAGTAVGLTADTGYFWFFGPSNIEIVVKVLDGCSQNGHYWVFAGGLTDTEVVLTVTDTGTGERATYLSPPGTAFQPVQDTTAFTSCP